MPKQIDSLERQVARSVGARLKDLRERHGSTHSEIGEYLECSENTVKAYEKGERRISLADAIRLSRYFRMSIDAFVLGEQPRAKVLPITSLDQLKRERGVGND